MRSTQQRQVHPDAAVVVRHLDGNRRQEGPSGVGVADQLGACDHQSPARQRSEHRLRVVLQEDGDVTAPDSGYLFRDQLRRHLVGPVQQHPQQALAESLRPVHHVPAGLALTFSHSRRVPQPPAQQVDYANGGHVR